VEPVLRNIDVAIERVSRQQAKTIDEYTALHSEMALENRLMDLHRHASKGSDDSEEDSDVSQDSASDTSSSQAQRMGDRHTGSPQPRLTQAQDLTVAMGAGAGVPPPPKQHAYRTSALLMNLSITFLYMVNMYVVAPTSGKYAALLGSSPSMAGAIIGLAPLAALVTAVLYSEWSNVSYRAPLMCGCYLNVVGNLLYAMAMQVSRRIHRIIGNRPYISCSNAYPTSRHHSLRTHTYTYTLTHTHTHTYTYIHTHIHTHTHTRQFTITLSATHRGC
jgi:hypothetical protein